MDLFSVLALVVFIAMVLAIFFVPRPKDRKPSLLDTSGVILNLTLGVMVYPPLCVAAMLLGIDSFASQPFLLFLERVAVAMGRLMPAVSVAGIGVSVVLRRKGKEKLSFFIQFAGLVFFTLTFFLAKLCGSY